MRYDGRAFDQMRPVSIQVGFTNAPGSVLIKSGNTWVLCTASISGDVPPFLRGSGKGWLTAEYGMLPASTKSRKSRPTLKPDGRATEIQRLIGRSLRAAVDLEALGEKTITLDCDVLQADGGTRTASITGAFVALKQGVAAWMRDGTLSADPIRRPIAAVSCGIVEDQAVLDLPYPEDSRAQVDMNIVMTGEGEFVEVQGTGEGRAFSPAELQTLLSLAEKGCRELFQLQKDALAEAGIC